MARATIEDPLTLYRQAVRDLHRAHVEGLRRARAEGLIGRRVKSRSRAADGPPLNVAALRATVLRALARYGRPTRNGPVVVQAGRDRILKQDVVAQIAGIKRTTIWEQRRKGQFPPARPLTPGGRKIGFLESEVFRWIAGERAWGAGSGSGRGV